MRVWCSPNYIILYSANPLNWVHIFCIWERNNTLPAKRISFFVKIDDICFYINNFFFVRIDFIFSPTYKSFFVLCVHKKVHFIIEMWKLLWRKKRATYPYEGVCEKKEPNSSKRVSNIFSNLSCPNYILYSANPLNWVYILMLPLSTKKEFLFFACTKKCILNILVFS